MVRSYVAGRELTCGVMDGKALAVTEVIAKANTFYDYDSKYAAGGRLTSFRRNFHRKFTKNTRLVCQGP